MTWAVLSLLLAGAGVTAAISVVSVIGGLLLGIAICGASLARSRALRGCAAVYVSFFRGVPLLVQLLLLYHALPRLGLDLPGIAAAVLGLTLCTAAYQAETLRGGFVNVPAGLIEAGRIVGMTARQIMLRVRAPIALRLTLPAVVNEAILILKASSLVSVVGVADLTRTAQNIASSNYRPIETFAAAGALYLLLNIVVGGAGAGLGRMVGRGR